jgi:N utilization substance protein B
LETIRFKNGCVKLEGRAYLSSDFFLEEGWMSRRTVREKVIQALYECEFHPGNEQKVIAARGVSLDEADREFFLRLAQGVKRHLGEIDPVISRFLKPGWTLERLSSVDRTIIRLGVYELLYEETPRAAVLNEAVELGKSFSGPESGRFINGVLGSVAANLEEIKQEISSISEN